MAFTSSRECLDRESQSHCQEPVNQTGGFHTSSGWVGDKWECEGCGATILSGFGSSPISEHYRPEFKGLVERLEAEFVVNDC